MVASFLKNLTLLIGLILILAPDGVLFAQTQKKGKASPNQQAAAIQQAIESRVESVIKRHIPEKDFNAVVTVEIKELTSPNLPYLPGSASTRLDPSLPITELIALTKKVTIKVFLAPGYNKSHQKQISDVMFTKLALSNTRGDSVSFAKLDLALPDNDDKKATIKLAQMEKSVDQQKREGEQLKKERDDLRQELLVIKENPSRGIDPIKLSKKEIINYSIWVGLVTMLGLLFFIAFERFARAVRRSGEGVHAVAGALQQIAKAGGNRADAGDTRIQIANSPDRANALPSPKELSSRSATNSVVPAGQIDVLQDRLLQLHEELIITIDADAEEVNAIESLIVQHLSILLENPENVAKAVVTMELLGRDKANALFTRLAQGAQLLVLEFLKRGFYHAPKAELMLEAGEELKTRLMATKFNRVRMSVTEQLSELLLQISANDLVDVLRKLDDASVPRFFLYLTPAQIAYIFNELKSIDKMTMQKVALLMSKMPEVEQLTHLDENIITKLKDQINSIKDDKQRPYLKIYQSVIESAQDELGEVLIKALSERSKTVGSWLQKELVFISSLFQLPGEFLEKNIYESMGNRELASLVSSFPDEKKNYLMQAMDNRRQESIKEEIERLALRSKRQIEDAQKEARAKVLATLRRLKSEGLIDEVLAQSQNAAIDQKENPERPASSVSSDADAA